jgi:transcriptional regulator GlxA family with amidase domain
MNSRLDRITNWTELAQGASYKPASMAALAPASLRQLERYFLKKFDKTPRDWARELQCEKARELIKLGYSNKATASALGFTNEAEFCRIFKKIFGHPPQHFSPKYGLSRVHKNVAQSQSI